MPLQTQKHRIALSLLLGVAGLAFAVPKLSASTWSRTHLINTEAFQVIDDTNSSANLYLQFGDSVNKRLTYDITAGTFIFDDDLEVIGTVSGALLDLTNAENSEFITLTDSTNGDSVGIFSGTGDPNGVVTGQLGSLFLASDTGKTWRNNDGSTQWVELTTGSGAHMAKMTRASAQTINDITVTKIAFDTEEFDVGNIADATTNDRFNISKSGKYLISTSLSQLSDTAVDARGSVYIYVNGGVVREFFSSSSESLTTMQGTIVLDLSANDYIEMYAYLDSSSSTFDTETSTVYRPEMSVMQLDASGGSGGSGSSEWTDGGDTVYPTETDNVLIGATGSASNELEVVGTASGEHLHFGRLLTGSGNFIMDGVAIFNQDGTADNFRIESDNNENMFFVDGTNDRIGIGTSSPSTAFDVIGTLSGQLLDLNAAENSEYITLTDSTNGDSVGIFSGTGDPNGVVTGQLGSLFLASDTGKTWRNNDGSTQWVELTTGSGAHMAKMTRDAAQTLTNSAFTKIAFDAESFDDGGIADSTTNDRFDIVKSGKYLVTANLGQEGDLDAGERLIATVYVNGSAVQRGEDMSATASNTVDATVTAVLELSENDYVEFYVFHNAGSDISTETGLVQKPKMSVVQLDASGGSGGSGGSSEWADDGNFVYPSEASDNVLIGASSGNDTELEVVGTTSGSLLDLTNAANSEFITLTDSTNGDSVGIFSGTGDPNGVVTGQLGSLFLASDTGKTWRNNDGSTQWVELTTGSGAHMARMIRSTTQSIPTSTYTKLDLNFETFDVGGIADPTTNNRFDIVKDGKYLVHGRWRTTNLLDGRVAIASIYINGVQTEYFYTNSAGSTQEQTAGGSDVFDLSAGDYVELYAFHSHGSNMDAADIVMSVMQMDASGGSGGSGSSEWTDGGDTVYPTETDNVLIGATGTAETELEVVGTVSGSTLNISNPDGTSYTLGKLGVGTQAVGSANVETNLHSLYETSADYSSTDMLAGGAGMYVQHSENNLNRASIFALASFDSIGAIGLTYDATNVGDLVFGMSNGSADVIERMRITNNGYVGIGTTSPSQQLTVSGTILVDGSEGNSFVAVDNVGVAGSRFGYLFDDTGTYGSISADPSSTQGMRLSRVSTSPLYFGVNNATAFSNQTFTTQLTLDVNGRLGIGTTSPSSLLHVSSGTAGNAELILEADTDNNNENDNSFVTFSQDGGAVTGFVGLEGTAGTRTTDTTENAYIIGSANSHSDIQFITNNTVRTTIDNTTGYVGIGTIAPDSRLEVESSNANWSGALLVDMNTETSGTGVLIYSEAERSPGLAISMGSGANAIRNPHISFGYKNIFDVKLFRKGTGSLSIQSETGSTLTLDTEMTGTTNMFTMVSDHGGNENTKFRFQADGEAYADGSWNSLGADFAEWFPTADPGMEPGDIACLDPKRPKHVKRCNSQGLQMIGIVSTNPGFVGNSAKNIEGKSVLVGMMGQVPVKVRGKVKIGDSITLSKTDGVGKRATGYAQTVCLAMEPHAGKEVGKITCLLSRNNASSAPPVNAKSVAEYLLRNMRGSLGSNRKF